MIKSVRLTNWRSHSDTLLTFSEGTNLLVGIMGAGKSSILEAISFALFGTFPALERRKLKMEDILRMNEPQAKAVLELSWGGKEYRIERTIERGKRGTSTGAQVFCDNSLVEQGQSAATTYMQGVLGLDYDLFTRAIYSEQNNIDHFLTLDPRRRKEEMDALLGLDRFESARASAVSVINRVSSNRKALEARFSRERLSSLEAREAALAGESSGIDAELKAASAAYGKHMKDAASTLSSYENMRKVREAHERLSREIIRLLAQKEALAKAMEGKTGDEAALQALDERLKALAGERTALAASLKAAEDAVSSLSREGGSIEARIKAAAESKARLSESEATLKSLLDGNSPEGLQGRLRDLEASMLSMEAERKSLEREAAEAAESLKMLRPGLSECPLCSSKLTDDGISHVKSEKEAMMRAKKERASGLAAGLAKAKKEAEALSERSRRASSLSERLAQLRQDAGAAAALEERKKALETQMKNASDERDALRSKSEPLAAEIEKLKVEAAEMRSHLSKKAEAAAVSARLRDAESSLAKLAFDEKAFEGLRDSAERSRIEGERMLSRKNAAEAALKHSAEMLRAIRDELGAVRAVGQDISHLALLEEQLAIFKNALTETQAGLRISLTEAINAAMNEIWPVFYPYKNYRSLRLLASEKDYIFEVDGGGGWRGLETVASGGERASAALTLRVALAMVLTPKLGWLILDEPTHNLDSEAVALLSSSLQFRVPEVVKQTFVITHDEAFMGSEFASSYRMVRDKARNGETKIEQM